MNYKSLKVLDTVIAHNSFQEAAYTLHITQSAVSQSIKQIIEPAKKTKSKIN